MTTLSLVTAGTVKIIKNGLVFVFLKGEKICYRMVLLHLHFVTNCVKVRIYIDEDEKLTFQKGTWQ